MLYRYEILSDSNKRAAYDAGGMDGLTGRGGGAGMDPADIFAQMFGQQFAFDFGPQMRGGGRRGGEDSVIPHKVTLEDLYNGKSIKMNMEKEVVCSVCKGYGFLTSCHYLTNLFFEDLAPVEMQNQSHVRHVVVMDGLKRKQGYVFGIFSLPASSQSS